MFYVFVIHVRRCVCIYLYICMLVVSCVFSCLYLFKFECSCSFVVLSCGHVLLMCFRFHRFIFFSLPANAEFCAWFDMLWCACHFRLYFAPLLFIHVPLIFRWHSVLSFIWTLCLWLWPLRRNMHCVAHHCWLFSG